MGIPSSIYLNLIKWIKSVNNLNKGDIFKQYSDVFKGIGCLNTIETCHIHIKKKCPACDSPNPKGNLMSPLKESLKELTDKKVEGPSDWVNPLVLVRKLNGKLRICIDPKDLNKWD